MSATAANLGAHHLMTGLDNDIPGLPLICDYTSGHEYNNAFDAELTFTGVRNPYYNRDNRIVWPNDKEVASALPVESNGHQMTASSFQMSSDVQKAIESILQIADHIRKDDEENNVNESDRCLRYSQNRLLAGNGGLEIRGNGFGPTLPLDLHTGLSVRYLRHHSSGALSLRPNSRHRPAIVPNWQMNILLDVWRLDFTVSLVSYLSLSE